MAKRTKKISIKDILKGKFLVERNSLTHWKFVGFLAILAFISILSSHLADRKAVKIRHLQTQVSNLKSEYAFIHKKLMQSHMRSNVEKEVINDSLYPPIVQPYKIIEQ